MLAGSDLWTGEEATRDCIAEAAPVVCERLSQASVASPASYPTSKIPNIACIDISTGLTFASTTIGLLCSSDAYSATSLLRRLRDGQHVVSRPRRGRYAVWARCERVRVPRSCSTSRHHRMTTSPDAMAMVEDQTPDRRLRIASIGCGPSHEIRNLLQEHPEVG